MEEHIGTGAIYLTGATAGLLAAIVITFLRSGQNAEDGEQLRRGDRTHSEGG